MDTVLSRELTRRTPVDYVDPVATLLSGVRGRVASVLAHADQPLSVRQLAARCHASPTQVTRHVEAFAELGIVTRRAVGPAYEVQLTDSAASHWLRSLADLRSSVLDEMQRTAQQVEPVPSNVTLFGSFARGDATVDSDIDVLVVRPPDAGAETWADSLGWWADHVSELAGNPVSLVEVKRSELDAVGHDLRNALLREGIVLLGPSMEELLSGP